MAQGGGGNRGKSLLPDRGELNHRERELKGENRRTVVSCHLDHDDAIVPGRSRWRKRRRRRRKRVLVWNRNSVEKVEDKNKASMLTRTKGDVGVNAQSEHTTRPHYIATPTTRPNNSLTQATHTKGKGATDVLRWPRPAAKFRHSSLTDPTASSPSRERIPAPQLSSGSNLNGKISMLLRTRRRHHWLRGKRDAPGQRMSQRRAILALWEASGRAYFAAPAKAVAGDRNGDAAPLYSRSRANGFRLPESADHKEASNPDLRAPPPPSHQLLPLRSNKDQSTTRNSPAKRPKSPRNVSSAGKARRRVPNEEGNSQPPRHATLGTDNDDNDNSDNYGYDNGGHGYEGCIYFTPSYSSSPHLPPNKLVEGGGVGAWRQHVVETVLTVVVKDINDNAPLFPNTTIYGQVQENGAASKCNVVALGIRSLSLSLSLSLSV